MPGALARIGLAGATLLGALACGPPQPSAESSGEAEGPSETGSDTTETSTSTSTTTTDTDDQTDTDESDAFVPKFDMEEESRWCDPFVQDCPPGEKCSPYLTEQGYVSHTCVLVLGDVPPGEPCHSQGLETGLDDCDETSACWPAAEIEGETIGICSPFCLGTADTPECPPNSSCELNGSGGMAVCVANCDPLAEDCPQGLGCYWVNLAFQCFPPKDDIPTGEPCGYINDCAPTAACLVADVLPECAGSACCSIFCDVELGDQPCIDALPGTSCVPFFEFGMAPPGYETTGVCILP